MADDYDDSVLLDSDDAKTKKSKPSDFIPKPRLLTSPVTKIASIASLQSSTAGTSSRAQLVDVGPQNPHADMKFTDVPADSTQTDANSETSMNFGKACDLRGANGTVEPSKIHLVDEPPTSTRVKVEESTYKRLISDSPTLEGQPECDEKGGVRPNSDRQFCLCQIIKHPVIRTNWKVYVGSFVLMVLGLGLVTLGLLIGATSGFLADAKSLVFLAAGILLLLPGGYHFLFMSLAVFEVRGFKFAKLPTIRQQ